MSPIKLELRIKKSELIKKLGIKDGKPGKNADEDKIIQRVLKFLDTIPKPKGEEESPEQLRDKLENLPKGQKLTINAIEDLAKLLEELDKMIRKSKLGLLQGSTHARGNQIRFVDDETLTGTVDGVNAVFTTSKTPLRGSLKVYLGGGRMRVDEDYTLSGKTITFTIAPQPGEVLL